MRQLFNVKKQMEQNKRVPITPFVQQLLWLGATVKTQGERVRIFLLDGVMHEVDCKRSFGENYITTQTALFLEGVVEEETLWDTQAR